MSRDTGIDEFFVMVRKTGDGWQVDAVATAAYGQILLENMTEGVIDDVVNEICDETTYSEAYG